MSHTFKKKIRILQKIMNNQCKFLESCKEIRCIVEYKSIIIRKYSIISENRNTHVKFPTKDIDSVIIRERARLHNYNKSEPKGLDTAIKEIGLIDKIKEITNQKAEI